MFSAVEGMKNQICLFFGFLKRFVTQVHSFTTQKVRTALLNFTVLVGNLSSTQVCVFLHSQIGQKMKKGWSIPSTSWEMVLSSFT